MKFQRQFRRHSLGGSTYQKMDDGCAAGIDMRFGERNKKNLESIPVRRLSNSNINNYSSNHNHKYVRIQDSNRNLNVDGNNNNNNNKESFSKTKLERIFGTTLKKATAKATIAADFVNAAIITTATKKRKPIRNGIRRRRNSLSRSVATQATETLSSEFVIAIPTKIQCGEGAPINNDDDDISVLSLDKALR